MKTVYSKPHFVKIPKAKIAASVFSDDQPCQNKYNVDLGKKDLFSCFSSKHTVFSVQTYLLFFLISLQF